MGELFDKQQFYNNPQYNMKLGQAYFSECLEKFGSPLLASVAYKMGDSTTSQWIKQFGDPAKGVISEADFLAKIPNKALAAQLSPLISNQSKNTNSAIKAQEAAIETDPNLSGEQKQYAKAVLSKNIQELEEQSEQLYQVNYQSVWRDRYINKVPLNEISAERLAALPKEDRARLMQNKPDPDLNRDLWLQAIGRVNAGEKFNLLQGYGDKLPVRKLDNLLNYAEDLKNNPKKSQLLLDRIGIIKQKALQCYIWKKDDMALLYGSVNEEVWDREQQNKQSLSQAEFLSIVNKHLLTVNIDRVYSDEDRDALDTRKPYYLANRQERNKAYTNNINDVHGAERQAIEQSLQNQGLPAKNKDVLDVVNRGIRHGQ